MNRFTYDPGVEVESAPVLEYDEDSGDENPTGRHDEITLDGFHVRDTVLCRDVAFCRDRDDAERITRLLNLPEWLT